LDQELDRGGRPHPEDDLSELRQEQRADGGGRDAAVASCQRRPTEDHRRDRRQQVGLAGL
jgi:hypothetical protein